MDTPETEDDVPSFLYLLYIPLGVAFFISGVGYALYRLCHALLGIGD